MGDKGVFIPVDFDFLKDKKSKMNILFFGLDNSVWDKTSKKRVLSKDKINYAQLAREVRIVEKSKENNKPQDPRTVKQAIQNMIKDYPNIVKEDNGDLLFNTEMNGQNYTIALSHETIRRFYTSFNDNVTKLYIYLFRQYQYWTNVKKAPGFDFTITQLCEELGYTSNNKKNRIIIRDSLHLLVINGLITYKIVRKGKGYYRRLIGISKTFKLLDIVEAVEEKITENLEEVNDIESLSGDAEEEVLTVGYSIDDSLTFRIANSFTDLDGPVYTIPEIEYRIDAYGQSWVETALMLPPENLEKLQKSGLIEKYPNIVFKKIVLDK